MRPWRVAMQDALYGENGFFRRRVPSDHFRTSAHTGHTFAVAILSLLDTLDEALGRPEPLDVVDIGAGEGELLAAISELAPIWLQPRLRLTAVEINPRPAGLTEEVAWLPEAPDRIAGLLIATEWLDNVPVDVVARDHDGWRYVLVDEHGVEMLGEPPNPYDAAWLETWWPEGERAEVGRSRDAAWAAAVGRLERGLALAIDYCHTSDDRPPLGSLAAYRDGLEVQPVPDGSCDLTAHVAIDAAASAVVDRPYWLVRQSEALRSLGLTGRRPSITLAHEDPGAYIRALADASVAAELTDVTGLGGHWWLWQPIGIDLSPPTMNP
jgi:SAM-dependent MidA family methyltransferase